ncbi:MAG: hypothetical protein LBG07_05870 [Treponema sp.]|nr:hypothetical protein [Treponema sp.]
MEVFQAWDQWKSAMMTLPEDVFFDLLRSVFGHVKTPFNKQNLLSDLAAFLSREDIRRNIAAYIDEADAQVIAAVALLGNPSAAELEQFFADDGMGIAALLLNLEERFILYRYREGGTLRLGLNPVLEPVLAAIAGDMSRLFPSLPSEAAGNPAGGRGEISLDDRFFAALISFVLEEGNLFRTEGRRAENRLRRKVQDAGRRLFPGLDLEQAIRGLLCLGLCRFAPADAAVLPEDTSGAPPPERESLNVEERALESFAGLEPRHRLIYWAAGLCLGTDPVPEPQLLREKIRNLARLVDRLFDFLSPGRLYPLQTLRRMFFFLERESGGTSAVDIAGLCAALARTGLLCGTALADGLADGLAYGFPAPAGVSAGQDTPAEPGGPVLTLDAPLFCLVYPGIEFADALTLAYFTAARETGRIFRFEITRESCLRGFERGLGAADMGELLARLSGNPVEDPLLWTLRDWEKRSAEVSLFEGAVLALSPERRYLTEAEPLAALIRRELAPGLYLLDSGDQAAEALRKAGVDIVARHRGQPEAERDRTDGKTPLFGTGEIHNPFPPLAGPGYQDTGGSAMMEVMAAGTAGQVPPCVDNGAETLKARFHRVLNSRTLSVPERNELASRVERRLVLTETQLSSASVRGEKLEARDLDYVGKASIARYAISSHSLVEVVWPAADSGGEQWIMGVPLSLEKSRGESILVIEDTRAQEEADTARVPGDTARIRNTVRIPGNTVRIPLGKISLLRRIKKSMFET